MGWPSAYDTEGYISVKKYQSESSFDARPKDGAWGIRYVRNEQHLPERVYYLGRDGEDSPDSRGVAYVEQSFDELGLVTSYSTFRSDGSPHELNGVARTESETDDHGNLLKERYLDSRGQPVLGQNGYAEVRYTWSKQGERLSTSFFGIDGEPTLSSSGMHRIDFEPGKWGWHVSQSYFDVDDSATLSSEGYHRVEIEREPRADGNQIRSLMPVRFVPMTGEAQEP
jgi:hypothetical protein